MTSELSLPSTNQNNQDSNSTILQGISYSNQKANLVVFKIKRRDLLKRLGNKIMSAPDDPTFNFSTKIEHENKSEMPAFLLMCQHIQGEN